MSESHPIEGIFDRIRRLRLEHSGPRGKAAFARKIDLSPSTYDYYENSRIPPAEVLLRIAELTGADLRWLLTGEEGREPIPATHPTVARAKQLLSEHPDCAAPLAAFMDLLAEAAEKVPAGEGQSDAAPARAPALTPGTKPAVAETIETDGQPQRQGWIPILGRSAAGVAHFWREIDGGAPATTLADLVAQLPAREARHVREAQAEGDLADDGETAQLVLLDSPEPPGTAEFVIAQHIARHFQAPFAVRIDGTSMAPEIRHGDVVILSPDCPAEPGRPAVVQLADQIGVTCKLVRFDGDRIHLIPINDAFPPTTHDLADLQWALKVIARIRPM